MITPGEVVGFALLPRPRQGMRPFRAALRVLIAAVGGVWAAVGGVAGCAARVERVEPVGAASPAWSDVQRDLHIRSFDHVWQTIATRHFDPTLGGLDWGAVRAELRPRVVQATSAAAARAAMNAMLGRLGQSHFGIIPAEAYAGLSAARPTREKAASAPGAADDGGPGEAGLAIRVLENRAVVWRVRAGGPAAAAGIAPGMIVDSVDGVPVDGLIGKVRAAGGDLSAGHLNANLATSLEGRFDGAAGERVAVALIDGAGRRVEKTIVLAPPAGLRARLGNLPEMIVECESRALEPAAGTGGGRVAYLRLSMFFEPGAIMPRAAEAVELARSCDGLIIDLRGNLGGIGAMAMGIGGLLVSEPDQRLGVMTTRNATIKFVLNPRLNPYTGPVAVLVDGLSLSTSEILAGGLQDIGRARVFGERTGGAALPSVVERLPSGDGFQYAFANYISAGGQPLEGRGVTPDVAVPLTRAALLAGRDECLDAAAAWVRQGAEQKARRARAR